MKQNRIRPKRTKSRAERPWEIVLPLDPRDKDVVRVKCGMHPGSVSRPRWAGDTRARRNA